MRAWNVAGALLVGPEGLLLVRNERPTGSVDWSTPGGVIDPTDASFVDGLAREVEEETGLLVDAWAGHVYTVRAEAPDLGWIMHCEVHQVAAYSGEISLTDPDGIVTDAVFVAPEACGEYLAACRQWVREPLESWLAEQWVPGDVREFHYRIRGSGPADFAVERVEQ
jgi:8-oxo-dGTP pyrophosphatase MutT (NUDIX family)